MTINIPFFFKIAKIEFIYQCENIETLQAGYKKEVDRKIPTLFFCFSINISE